MEQILAETQAYIIHSVPVVCAVGFLWGRARGGGFEQVIQHGGGGGEEEEE
jgi:hypothetical protein